jgi:hypothetical protein
MFIWGVSHRVVLARTSADAKTLELEAEQVASFSRHRLLNLSNGRCHPIAAFELRGLMLP